MTNFRLPRPHRAAAAALAGAAVLGAAATSLTATASADVTSAVAIAPLRPVPHADGTVTFRLHVPGPGTVAIRETAWADNFSPGFGPTPAPAPGTRFTFASASVTASSDGFVPVAVAPNADGRRLIAHHTFKPLVRLWVTFTPAAGTPSDVGVYGLQIPAASSLSR